MTSLPCSSLLEKLTCSWENNIQGVRLIRFYRSLGTSFFSEEDIDRYLMLNDELARREKKLTWKLAELDGLLESTSQQHKKYKAESSSTFDVG